LSETNPFSSNKFTRLTITLYAFGNSKSPRLPRENKDVLVENELVRPTQPPTGASTFADIQNIPLTGHYYKLDQGIKLLSGLGVIADGKDVGGVHSPLVST